MRIDKLAYQLGLAMMLLRGTAYQLLHLRFRGWLLLDRGARVRGLDSLHLNGPAKIGAYATLDARFCHGVWLGRMFALGDFSIMRASGSADFIAHKVLVGDRVSFGPYCNIGGGFGLTIGDDCVFGPYVSIHPESHSTMDHDQPIRVQGVHGQGIVIGQDNWVGAKTTLLDGARIGSGCVFGAGSIAVGRVYADQGIYVGVPAQHLKDR